MPIPVRRLLAGSAVAGLLFLFPLGDANAQDNRNNGGWIEGGVVLSLIAAAVGAAGGSSLTVWRLSKDASKGKRDNGKMDAVLARFDQLDSGVSAVGTNLEECINNGVNKLTSTVEHKTSDFNDRFNQLDSNVEILSEELRDHEKSLKLSECEKSLKSLKESIEDIKESKRKKQDQEQKDSERRWKITKNLCENFYTNDNSQKTSPIDYLKLIHANKSVKYSDCLDAAKKLLSHSLEILPEADKSAKEFKDFNSEKIDQLFELLWKLGTDFRDKMQEMKEDGEKPRTSKAAEVFGRKYASQDDEYIIEYKGKPVDMRQHLKIDSKRKTHGKDKASDNSYLRIHFAWHDESKKVLISHCGKHR